MYIENQCKRDIKISVGTIQNKRVQMKSTQTQYKINASVIIIVQTWCIIN